MWKPRFSIRELLLLTACAALAAALLHDRFVEDQPVYLHVFGTAVDDSHDLDRPHHSPTAFDGRPWTRIATVRVYDRRSFGMFTPNDRRPAIAIHGKLTQTLRGTYQGTIHFSLDDNNLTYDVTEKVDLGCGKIIYIDDYYDCYLLSRSDDPYASLAAAIDPDDSRARVGGK